MKYIPIIYIVILLLLATLPINGSSTSSILNDNYTLNIRWDYLVHALVYIPLIPLLWFSLAEQRIVKITLLSVLSAISLEAVQFIIPWRTFSINDLVSNILGVGVGFVLLRTVKRTWKKN